MGKVFNIQRFSLHDGPGIRTTFFLMGCSLKCRWCHNPEGINGKIQIQFNEKDCLLCGTCVKKCPYHIHKIKDNTHTINFEQCRLCGKCIENCPTHALQFSGKEYTSKELAAQGIRDIPFYKNDGGITFSGGEPLLQADFVAKTAKICKECGIPTIAVDTAGNVEWKAFEKVLPWIDYFLFDIKAAFEETHITGTGYSNHRILENLFKLDCMGKKIFIRIPLIPTINNSKKEIEAIYNIIKRLNNVEEIRVIPYHTFGKEKYTTLGLSQSETFPIPDDETVNDIQKFLTK